MRALGFFGQPGRLAACTAQPEGVQWIFRFFFVGSCGSGSGASTTCVGTTAKPGNLDGT